MKKTTLLIILFLLGIIISDAQKNITIFYNTNVDTLKNILGGNRLWENTIDLIQNEGIDMIRIHDYHDAGDYCFYSKFWNTNLSGDFTTINTSFNPNNPFDYDWNSTDSIINQIISNNFSVYFRIGVSFPNPSILPMCPYTPPYSSVTDTLNFSKFASLSKHTVMHYNHSWDNGFNYNIKYWEVWNEPGGAFWDSSATQFYQMYREVSDSIKYYDSTVFVGGPGAVPTTTIGINPKYREHFIEYCANNNIDLDFYSWHIYGAKNPYGIKMHADTIRNILNANGFVNSQSIISEINLELSSGVDTLKDSPYGAAYYLSTVLTMYDTYVDKLLWYPSSCHVMNFSGDTISSRSYYALSSLKKLQTETPIRVNCLGSEVVDNAWDQDTTNLMILAGKSVTNDKLYFLISNLNSDNSSFNINLENLPWNTNDSIKIIRNEITYDNRYLQTDTTVIGNNTIAITANNFSSPSVLFYRVEKQPTTNIFNLQNDNKIIITNPVKENIKIKNIPETCKLIEIYNINGQRIMVSENKNEINVNSLSTGMYFIVFKDNKNTNIDLIKFQKL